MRLLWVFNPNKAGLFKVFSGWECLIWPFFISQEELIWYQYHFIQLLNNLLKVGKKLKNANIICYIFLLFLCNKKISQNSKSWWKYWRRKLFEWVEEFQWSFEKRCDFDNIKSHKKYMASRSLYKMHFWENQKGEGG